MNYLLFAKRCVTIAALFILTMLYATDTKATHLAAADIFIKYVGAGFDPCDGKVDYTYEVTLVVYRDCQGQELTQTTWNVTAASINGGDATGPLTVNIPVTSPPDPDTVDQLCPFYSQQNTCRDPNAPDENTGYHRRIYKGTVTLPSAQTDWVFSWSGSARNNAIWNLLPPLGALYVEAGLNNVVKHDIGTPVFTNDPLPYLCNGVLNTYLNGPVDPNGDSIVVSLRPALSGPTAEYQYRAPYTYLDPTGSQTVGVPFQLNPVTGTATFRAPDTRSFVLAFRCDKYERGSGQLLGYTMRDVQVKVYPCSAPPPPIDSLPSNVENATIVGPTGSKMIYACPGSPIKFDVHTETPDASNLLYMRSTNDATIPGSSFSTVGDGTNSVTGTFSWTPTDADLGDHALIIVSIDSTCRPGQPILLKSSVSYTIRVVKGLDAGDDQLFCLLNGDEKQLFVRNAENLNVSWTAADGSTSTITGENTVSPKVRPTGNTTYIVRTQDLKGTCKVEDDVALEVDDANTVEIFPSNANTNKYVVCRPDYIQLEAKFKGGPPLNNLNCGIDNPIECTTPDSLGLYGSRSYGKETSYDTLGSTSPVFANNVQSSKHQYLIRRQDLWEQGFRSATFKSLSFEIVKAKEPDFEYANFSIGLKCTKADSLSATKGFEGAVTTVYTSVDPIKFPDGIYKFTFDTPYNWDTSQNLIVQLTYKNNPAPITACTNPGGHAPTLRFSPTSYTSGLMYKPADETVPDVTGAGNPAGIVSLQTRPVFGLTFCEAPPAPLVIKWTPSAYLSDTNILQPLAYVPRSISYVVETYGRNACIIRDTIDIHVPVHNFQAVPSDTVICFGETAPIEIRNGFAYRWHEYENGEYKPAPSLNCQTCAKPIAKPKKTTHYKIVVFDEVWCADTLDAIVKVLPLPQTKILNRDTVIKYGSSIQLLATGAKLYNWMPAASIDNPNISYPTATPTASTKYVVGGIGNNGCRSYDTLNVSVDTRDDLLVPTAFTPDGDGKNDRFRVANLTFQKLMEFRVFNRWGQEVYNGTDNKGWDGTWKGQEQSMGTYQYVIRVAYPDGFAETYKGDVTLIR